MSLSHGLVFSAFCLLMASSFPVSAAQADKSANPTPAIEFPFSPNQTLEFQLQARKLQLEQQILQINQQLLQLQQQNALKKPHQAAPVDLQWVAVNNNKVPADAVIAAYADGKPLYICHADYQQSKQAGQLTDKGCVLTYGGRVMVQTDYQVLTGHFPVIWRAANMLWRFRPPYNMPINNMVIPAWQKYSDDSFEEQTIPVPGGMENDRPQYICRAMLGYQIHVGKVVSGKCNVAGPSSEVLVDSYEVLFAKGPH